MDPKNRGLDRGLEALLADTLMDEKEEQKPETVSKNGGLAEIAVNNLIPGRFQPRKLISQQELEELASSIRSQGILQPLVVRKIAGDKFEIIAGERRWRAAQLAGLKSIPVVIKEVPDKAAAAISLIENIQRENLNPLEEAAAIERLIADFGLNQTGVAQAIGKSRAAVANLIRLNNLEPVVKDLLRQGLIDFGHAKVLLGTQGHEQIKLAQKVAEQQLSVRATEELVNKGKLERLNKMSGQKSKDPNISGLENNLSEKIGYPVKIMHNRKGKGKLVIKYNNLDELDGILAVMQYES